MRAATAETMFDWVNVVIVGLAEGSDDCQMVTRSLGFSTDSLLGRVGEALVAFSSNISFQTLMLRRL